MTKAQKVWYYVLLTIVSLLFIFSAISKLTANPQAVAGFQVAHLPIWFMYFIGVAEVAGAIGIWIKLLQRLAILGLSIILIGAVVVTAIFVSVPEAILPLVVMLALWVIVRLSKRRSMPAAPSEAPAA